MDVRAEIERVCQEGGRHAGGDAERRAARRVEERLREMGRDVEAEPIDIHPRWTVVYAIFSGAAVVGSLLSVKVPAAGFGLVLLTIVFALGDAGGVFRPVRRLTGRRASQNVVSREGEDRPGQIVLVAHVDSSRSGLLFRRVLQERLAVLAGRLNRPIGPFTLFMASLLVLLGCTFIRLLGMKGIVLTAVQFVPTVLLLLALVALLDVAAGKAVPGANDNASGVATALRLAERFGDGRLEHFALWVLLTGGQESFGSGMRAFLKHHKRELDPERTVFVNVDEVGAGTVRFGRREGIVLPGKSHPQLFEIAQQIAEDDGEDGAFSARSQVFRSPTDASYARAAGFPAITISCRNAVGYVPSHHQPTDTPDRIDDDALERAYGFCAELIERLDAEIGPDLTRIETLLAEDDTKA